MSSPKMPEEFREASEAAAHKFLGEDVSLSFIRHGQNVTSRVDASSGQYLLRVHRPSRLDIDPSQELLHSVIGLESECAWLCALADNTELKIQRPIAGPDGGFVLEVPLVAGGPFLPCTLLRWLPGEVLDGPRTQEQATELGEVLATLQNHAETWCPPESFARPYHGLKSWSSWMDLLPGLVDKKVIAEGDSSLVYEVMEKANEQLGPLELAPERNGLIHADLHESNYLIDGDEVHPIDFGRAGFGTWLYDLAESIAHLYPERRRAMLKSYSELRPFGEGDLQILEAYVVMTVVDHCGIRARNPKEHGDINEHMPNWARYFRCYLDDTEFLLG